MSRQFFVVARALVCAAAVLMLTADRSWGQFGGEKEVPAAKKKAKDPLSDAVVPAAKKEAKKDAKPKVARPAASTSAKSDLSAEQRIEKALDEPTSLGFTETPFSDVIQFLKMKHGIEIQLDKRGLDDAGIGLDVPITKELDGVTFRSALNLLLRDLDLTYTIQDETLLITTRDAADAMLLTRVYDVADLVTVRDERGQRWEDYDTLIDLITTAIVPQSWDEVGGPGGISPGSLSSAKVLVVSHTYEVHRTIAKLLEDIRKIAAKNPSDEPPLRHRPKPCHEESHAGMGGGMGGMTGSATQDKDGKDKDHPAVSPKPNKPDKDEDDDDDDDHDRESRGRHAGGGMF